MNPRLALFLLVALFVLAADARAQPTRISAQTTGVAAQSGGALTSHFPSSEALTTLVRTQLEQRKLTGMVIGLLESDGSTRIVSLGHPGPEARPLGGRSLFEIGSMTKAFTATLLADMVARGEVSLQDPVSKFLPSTVTVPSRGGREITLVDLATHHSGLPRMFVDFTPADPANPYADFTVEKMYEYLSRYELPRDVGSKGEYSNLGVGLLGHALTRVTNRSYEAIVRERILDPLEMRMTGISLAGEMRDWMVKGHNRRGQVVPLWDAPAIAGAGALRSNAEDLLKFVAANVGPPTSRLQRAMRESHAIQKPAPGNAAIGLAWQVFTYGDEITIRHSGGTGGFQSFMGFDPKKRVGAVVLINTTSGDRNDAQNIGMHLINPTYNPLR